MQPAALKGRSLLSLKDWEPDEIRYLLDLARRVKEERRRGERHQRFAGYSLALLFEKRSTRTRCAFETAFGEEGGHPVFLSTQDIHLGTKEAIEDTARVLGRMFDAIQYRGFKFETVEKLAAWSGVPVYNGLTDDAHPTQALADVMTLGEAFGGIEGRKLRFVGDGRNNVTRSLFVIASKLGLDFGVVSPKELFPDPALLASIDGFAKASGARLSATSDLAEGLKGADAVYTDVWVSMGEEAETARREALLAPYRVDAALMARTGRDDSVFLHCLPAIKGKEVSADVLDGPMSWAWEQAENRKHTIKALMLATIP
jgi:ornithine carbamoyltransferase